MVGGRCLDGCVQGGVKGVDYRRMMGICLSCVELISLATLVYSRRML